MSRAGPIRIRCRVEAGRGVRRHDGSEVGKKRPRSNMRDNKTHEIINVKMTNEIINTKITANCHNYNCQCNTASN